jgi:hypothetical protein
MKQKNFKIFAAMLALVLVFNTLLAACGAEPTPPAATEAPSVEQPRQPKPHR